MSSSEPVTAPGSDHVLPDLLRPGLDLVFCGTAAGLRSAVAGAYYAHPGNLFWKALYQSGLTPRQLAPSEFHSLLDLGIGLTDLAKHHAGNDADLPKDAFDLAALVAKIELYAPRYLAFTSKNAARIWRRELPAYGLQSQRIGATAVFVLPSPSGQARGHWDLRPWATLAAKVRAAE